MVALKDTTKAMLDDYPHVSDPTAQMPVSECSPPLVQSITASKARSTALK